MNGTSTGFSVDINFYFSWDQPQRVELLGCVVVTHSILEETTKLFKSVSAILYSQQHCMQVLVSLQPCQQLVSFYFYFSHPDRCVVMSYCGLNFHFPNGYLYWTSFHVFIWHPYILSSEISLHVLGPFFNWLIYSFIVDFWKFFNIFQIGVFFV